MKYENFILSNEFKDLESRRFGRRLALRQIEFLILAFLVDVISF